MLYITQHNATGIYGYRLIQDQTVIMNSENIVLPDRQPAISKDLRTAKVLLTHPLHTSEHPTIVPGLRVRFTVYNESDNMDAVFEQEYGAFWGAKTNVYLGGKCIFTYSPVYPPPDAFYNAPDGAPIACVENDLTFRYEPCSTDEKRCTLNIHDDRYMEFLPYIFHVYVSEKLGVLS